MTSFTSLITRHYIVFALIIISFNLSKAQNPPAIFVFGDSLVDVGNNNYLPVSIVRANFLPNGIDFPGKEPTGRFSNGFNAADWIAVKLGLPLAPPYLYFLTKNISSPLTGVSFASAAAGIFNGTNHYLGQCLSMSIQLSYYERICQELVQKLGQAGAQKHLSKSIFAIVLGSNDILFYTRTPDLREKIAPQPYVDSMATTLKEQIKRLHALGARKFVFPGLGPLGCIPMRRRQSEAEDCDGLSNSMAVMYNNRLKTMLPSLSSELVGFSFSYSDTYTLMQNIIQKPATYGFTDAKAACCGIGRLEDKTPCLPISPYCSNRTNHVFWDAYHPSQAAAGSIANVIFDGPPQFTFPMNLRQLAAV